MTPGGKYIFYSKLSQVDSLNIQNLFTRKSLQSGVEGKSPLKKLNLLGKKEFQKSPHIYIAVAV